MPKRPRSHQVPPDDPGYVKAWARDLIEAVGKRQARSILDDYRAIAEDPKVTKRGREIASERARCLEALL